MGDTLSKALQKYYARKGNRIVFSNGMTLNQLAWEMWERLGYREIDPSVLSRGINHERLFRSKQLKIFSDILGLDSKKTQTLKEVLCKELFDRFGFDDSFFKLKSSYFLDFAEDNLSKIREVKFRSLPKLAESWSFALLGRLEDEIDKAYSKRVRNRLLSLKGNVLNEILDVQLAAEPLETMEMAVTESTNRLEEVGEVLKNRVFLGLAAALKGNMLNITDKDNKKAAILLEDGINLGLTEWGSIAAHRALAVSYANLHRNLLFDELRKTLLGLCERYPEHSDYILEGIARGEAILGRIEDARKTIGRAWDAHYKNEYSSAHYEIKEIETVRTEVEIAARSKEKRYGLPEKNVDQAILNSRKLGYIRMEQQIKTFKDMVDLGPLPK